jgi:DnaK suppressor protein
MPGFSTIQRTGPTNSDWAPNCTTLSIMQSRANQVDQSPNFHAILLAELTRLLSGRDDGCEVLTASESVAVDDQAPLLHEQFVAIGRRQINHRKLKLVDAALVRLEKGDFGVCQECGEGIPRKRLKIIPWAAHCVACQEQLDRVKALSEPELSLTA